MCVLPILVNKACYVTNSIVNWTEISFSRCRIDVRSLSTTAADETLVHAFVSSRLDYCNALLYGVADGLYRRLQSVQNAAARIVSGLRRHDHIRPTLGLLRLHWLPVRQRVLFKIAVLVYQCLNGLAPSYFADDVNSSPTSVRVNSVRATLWPAPSDVHGPPTATGVLLLLAHECGTLCRPN